MRSVAVIAAAVVAAATAVSAAAKEIELLRPAGMEASLPALEVVRQALQAKSFTLTETAVKETGDDAMATAIANDKAPPAAAILNGQELQALGAQRKLGDITAAALAGRWAEFVLLPIQPYLLSHERWVAAPLDVMPMSGLWVNASLMDKIGGVEPNDLDGLFALLDRARLADVVPLVINEDPRDLASLFDVVLVATGGADLYKKVFIDLNEGAIRSNGVKDAFENLARLRAYVATPGQHLGAKQAVGKVGSGEALAYAGSGATRLLFAASGKSPDKDYQCLRFPSPSGAVVYQPDVIAMLKTGPDDWAAQSALAEIVMDPEVQVAASLAKGSVPARGGVNLSKFDACGAKDAAEVLQAAVSGHLMPSTAYGYTQRASATAAYIQAVAKFYRGDIKSADEAAEALRSALTAGR
jgi:glucose/mannose transport system substrate-binding protein